MLLLDSVRSFIKRFKIEGYISMSYELDKLKIKHEYLMSSPVDNFIISFIDNLKAEGNVNVNFEFGTDKLQTQKKHFEEITISSCDVDDIILYNNIYYVFLSHGGCKSAFDFVIRCVEAIDCNESRKLNNYHVVTEFKAPSYDEIRWRDGYIWEWHDYISCAEGWVSHSTIKGYEVIGDYYVCESDIIIIFDISLPAPTQ